MKSMNRSAAWGCWVYNEASKLPVMLAAGARVTGEDTDTGIRERFKEWARELASKIGVHASAR